MAICLNKINLLLSKNDLPILIVTFVIQKCFWVEYFAIYPPIGIQKCGARLAKTK